MAEQIIATKLLNNLGYNSKNYQGDEYRDNTGHLNDYMPASEEMFETWIEKVICQWPNDLDKMDAIVAKRAIIQAINLKWRSG